MPVPPCTLRHVVVILKRDYPTLVTEFDELVVIKPKERPEERSIEDDGLSYGRHWGTAPHDSGIDIRGSRDDAVIVFTHQESRLDLWNNTGPNLLAALQEYADLSPAGHEIISHLKRWEIEFESAMKGAQRARPKANTLQALLRHLENASKPGAESLKVFIGQRMIALNQELTLKLTNLFHDEWEPEIGPDDIDAKFCWHLTTVLTSHIK